LYGTAGGGANGTGTVFKITPSGTLTTLHSFNGTDGNGAAALVQATDGNFYGTADGPMPDGRDAGTIFKMTPTGRLTTLYSFCSQSGCTDGRNPGVLVQATDGNFYGVTSGGGAKSCNIFGGVDYGCGTVFKITPSGTLTTLYSFGGGTDGQ
jgi:uncharacterized repeat protein (TIGR03803 family)